MRASQRRALLNRLERLHNRIVRAVHTKLVYAGKASSYAAAAREERDENAFEDTLRQLRGPDGD